MAEDRQIGITWSRRGCAARLRRLMELHEPELSMADLSRESDTPYAQIQNFRDGAFLPSDRDAESIAGALGVPMESLRVIDLGPDGAVHKAVNIAARVLVQAGWLFGLEPMHGAGRIVLVPVESEFLEDAIADWARAIDELEARPDKTPTGRPSKVAREGYLRWAFGYGMSAPSQDWLLQYEEATRRGPVRLTRALDARRASDRLSWRDAHRDATEGGRRRCGSRVRDLAMGWYSTQLKRLRRASGLTQAELAGRAGSSPSAVKSYETGRRVPKVRTNEALARSLGAMPEAFVTYDIPTPLQLVHTLMDMADLLGMGPSTEGAPHLEALKPPAGRLFEALGYAWALLRAGDETAFLDWYDRYDDAHGAK